MQPEKRDSEIHPDVRAELGLQPDDGMRSVQITVREGVVYLTGFVESYADKQAIHRLVGQIPEAARAPQQSLRKRCSPVRRWTSRRSSR